MVALSCILKKGSSVVEFARASIYNHFNHKIGKDHTHTHPRRSTTKNDAFLIENDPIEIKNTSSRNGLTHENWFEPLANGFEFHSRATRLPNLVSS